MRLHWVIALQVLRAAVVYWLVMSVLILTNGLTGSIPASGFTMLLALISIPVSYAGARFLRRRFPAAFPRFPKITAALRGSGVAIMWLGVVLALGAAILRVLPALATRIAAADTEPLTVVAVLVELRPLAAWVVIAISGMLLRNANTRSSVSLESRAIDPSAVPPT